MRVLLLLMIVTSQDSHINMHRWISIENKTGGDVFLINYSSYPFSIQLFRLQKFFSLLHTT